MIKGKAIKEQAYNHLVDLLDKKIEVSLKAIESAKESRDADTKSSVGDKYETGRAMMHIEMEKNEARLANALKQKNELSQINTKNKYYKVGFGCLVVTDQGNFLISIGIGKLEFGKENLYAISLASPIGKLMENKIIGDKVHFQGREIIINDII